jgi:copper chaperone
MKIAIDGMHCQACVNRVKKALSEVPGLQVREVGIGTADVVTGEAKEADVFKAIEKAGYTPHVHA